MRQRLDQRSRKKRKWNNFWPHLSLDLYMYASERARSCPEGNKKDEMRTTRLSAAKQWITFSPHLLFILPSGYRPVHNTKDWALISSFYFFYFLDGSIFMWWDLGGSALRHNMCDLAQTHKDKERQELTCASHTYCERKRWIYFHFSHIMTLLMWEKSLREKINSSSFSFIIHCPGPKDLVLSDSVWAGQ